MTHAIPYNYCEQVYAGQTKALLSKAFNQHKGNLKLWQFESKTQINTTATGLIWIWAESFIQKKTNHNLYGNRFYVICKQISELIKDIDYIWNVFVENRMRNLKHF